ncbi:MAG: hypothetical protein LUF80_00550 [Oscillospiraceae bacterium]|nr:hypothetical protein [Oscillospiraceae bacterium]
MRLIDGDELMEAIENIPTIDGLDVLSPDEGNIEFPEDVEEIKKYMDERGCLNVSGYAIEALWRAFSDGKRAGWLFVTKGSLEEFAAWTRRIMIFWGRKR